MTIATDLSQNLFGRNGHSLVLFFAAGEAVLDLQV